MSEFCGDHEEKAVKNETCEGQQDGQGSRSGQTGRRAEGGDPANDEVSKWGGRDLICKSAEAQGVRGPIARLGP